MNANPIAKLTAAEATLAGAINAAADRLDQLGTVTIDTAMARLQASAEAAKARLAAAMANLDAITGGVLDLVEDLTGQITLALEIDAGAMPAPALPVPAIPIEARTVEASPAMAEKPIVKPVVAQIAVTIPDQVEPPAREEHVATAANPPVVRAAGQARRRRKKR